MIGAGSAQSADAMTRDAELAELRARLREAEDALAALRCGAADALVGDAGIRFLAKQPIRIEDGCVGGGAAPVSAGALRRAAIVVESTREGVMVTDLDATIRYTNPAFSKITGFSADEVAGGKPGLLRSERHGPDFYAELWRTLRDNGHWRGEIWNRRKNGEAYLQWTRIDHVPAQHGEPAGFVSVFSDITDAWRRNERNAHLAYHDALTELPNRALLLDRLGHALEVAMRHGGGLAVLFIDLDGFKAVNDRLGHLHGDRILQEAACRLQASVRGSDTVARLGGDEFVVVVENMISPEECAVLADKLVAALSWQTLGGLWIGASIGIAAYPMHGADATTLLQRADRALYAAKAAGKGTFRFWQEMGV